MEFNTVNDIIWNPAHYITISQISVLSRQSLCLVHAVTSISVVTYLPACFYPLVSV